ncbi:MAG: DNA polymerase III subunit gamma/tau [Oscillospiraceae bacterium]|jgi:DNA polymerase-3 subunit gamma/tau|nr:DNA polymerase III subunit gamma/tau [Oscillospiraceae bacterium]
MYQVLYRKWRPQVFSDVYGQPHVTVTLRNELTSGRLAHAYLFTGSRGTGKTTCAKILAKAVNCLAPEDGNPCNKCENCIGIDNESILDVVEMDAASNNGVEDIRDLREEVRYTPATAKYRVLIIDEVHMLSNSAFNALLKTLEEPPEHVIFILATTEVHKLPATILSRCQRFDFKRISPHEISGRLTFVATQEGYALSPEAALLIARLADGGMRDALSLLDQCIGQFEGASSEIDEALVCRAAGIAGREHLFLISDAVISGDVSQLFEQIDSLHKGSKDMLRLTEELIEHFRSLMIYKSIERPESIVFLSSEECKRLDESAKQIKLEHILHAIDTLLLTVEKMSRSSNRRTELEMALLRIAKPELENSTAALARRIEALEKRGFSAAPLNRAQAAQQAGASPPVQRAPVVVPSAEKAAPIEQWNEILNKLKDSCMPLYSALKDSSGYRNEGFVFVDAPTTGLALLKQSNLKEYLRTAIKETLGTSQCNLGPYKTLAMQKEDSPISELERMASEAGIPLES